MLSRTLMLYLCEVQFMKCSLKAHWCDVNPLEFGFVVHKVIYLHTHILHQSAHSRKCSVLEIYTKKGAFRLLGLRQRPMRENLLKLNFKHFLFQSSLACNTFDIVPRRNGNGDYSVDIILKTPLDFERVRSYLLPVKAENTKFPNNFTTKNFVINVLDSQDQKPQFIKAPYSPLSNEEQPLVRNMDRQLSNPSIINQSINQITCWLT